MLAKAKLNNIAALISNVLIGSNFSYNDFVLINNVLKAYIMMWKKKVVTLKLHKLIKVLFKI